MKLETSIVGSTVKEGAEGVNSENAAVNEIRKSQMSGTKLKPLGIAGCQWYLPINGTRSSKAIIATLMTQKPKTPFTFTGA
jgi:hypothetical protein